MTSLVYGVDPDTHRHGLAIYEDGELVSLSTQTTYVLAQLAKENKAMVFIEDVARNNYIYSRNVHKSKNAHANIAMRVGRCQQAQIELMRMLDHLKVTVKCFPPQKNNWSKRKAQFELVTKWKGKSNEDTRSAAYFGWLGLASLKQRY